MSEYFNGPYEAGHTRAFETFGRQDERSVVWANGGQFTHAMMATVFPFGAQGEANATRIARCLDAGLDIPTDQLQLGVVAELVAASKDVEDNINIEGGLPAPMLERFLAALAPFTPKKEADGAE